MAIVEREKAVYIETYGCQMNVNDSGLVQSILEDAGYHFVPAAEEAGLILLNTCAVREKAHERIYARLEALRYLKNRNRTAIGILGCMAQNLSDDLFASGLPLDLIAGPDSYRQLPGLIRQAQDGPASNTRLSQSETYEDIAASSVQGVLGSVSIMRGCNNFCAFCVVPYTRGRERSSNPESVVGQINHLIRENGLKEVLLLGQNVNSYKHGETDFTSLVEKILAQTNIERIRFTSPHPHDFPVRLLELMATEERFCSQIHLPLQAGSDAVLGRMRRDYTSREFLELVNRIRDLLPGVGLTSDIIVGFPGESEQDFGQTLRAVEMAQFDMAFMFRYSVRQGTIAAREYPDDVPEAEKLSRLERLISLQNAISRERNKAEEGRLHKVLVEGYSRRSRLDLAGRSESGKMCIFPAEASVQIGKMAQVAITGSTSATLRGKLQNSPVLLPL